MNYGVPGWRPGGRLERRRIDTIGIWDPTTANFYLRDQNTGGHAVGGRGPYGAASYTPVVGDWNGDGVDTIGVIGWATVTYARPSVERRRCQDEEPLGQARPRAL